MSETSTGNYIDRPASSMTLRDYFAAKALQGMLSNYQWDDDATVLSTASYQYADAMMKERNK